MLAGKNYVLNLRDIDFLDFFSQFSKWNTLTSCWLSMKY